MIYEDTDDSFLNSILVINNKDIDENNNVSENEHTELDGSKDLFISDNSEQSDKEVKKIINHPSTY